MPFGGLLTFGIGTGLAGLSAWLSGRSSSQAAGQASDAQAAAATYAADLNFQAQREALQFQLGSLEQQQANNQPWLDAGKSGLDQLTAGLAPGGELSKPFEAPAPFDPSKVNMDPGFDFRMREATKALERSASARGGALGTGTQRAIARYSQDLASQEYGAAYGRSASEYDREFNNKFNVDQANRGGLFNRLASLAGVGQTATNQLNSAYQAYGTGAANTTLDTAVRTGDLATQAGNARASGYIGSANAWQNAVGGFNDVLGNLSSSLFRRT